MAMTDAQRAIAKAAAEAAQQDIFDATDGTAAIVIIQADGESVVMDSAALEHVTNAPAVRHVMVLTAAQHVLGDGWDLVLRSPDGELHELEAHLESFSHDRH